MRVTKTNEIFNIRQDHSTYLGNIEKEFFLDVKLKKDGSVDSLRLFNDLMAKMDFGILRENNSPEEVAMLADILNKAVEIVGAINEAATQ